MSTIQNEIDRIKESVADAYETVELMGGDVPSPDLQKIDTLSDSIATIKGGSGSGGSENILLNWDFRNPVNRSGSTTYSLTTTRCTVDSWYSENGCAVSVVDGGVTFDPKNDATCVFGQNVKEWELMKGKTVTFSALVSNVSAAGLNLWIYGVEGPVAFPAIEVGNDVTLYSITGTVDNGASSLRCGIQAVSSTATIKMIAAKLEYGSKQTLAKQNSDNVWEILDPPNYDLQYILCSQYDAVTSAWIGPQKKITGTTAQTAGFDANGNLAAVDSAPLADAIVSNSCISDLDMNNAPRGKIVNYLYNNNVDQASYHSPMGELYGTTGETWYVVETFGVVNRVVQTAAAPYNHQRKFFIRFKHDTTWSPWREIASLSDIPIVSNPNLLLNWDFRNPVNRNGQMEYTTGRIIDSWFIATNGSGKVEVLDGKITLSKTGGTYYDIRQVLNVDPEKTYTISILINDVLYAKTSVLKNIGGIGVPNGTVIIVYESGHYQLLVRLTSNASHSVTAVKLELGSTQTLAKKNASGEWEIIDPPDYDLQYLLCSQYSPLTGEWIGSQYSNPNLLLNWDFRNPVNRNGQMEYTSGYGIDRWSTKRIVLESDGIIFTESIMQYVYNAASLVGETLTMSVLEADGGMYSITGTLSVTTGWSFSKNLSIIWMGLALRSNGYIDFRVTFPSPLKIIAVKLELGSTQTLAKKNASGEWEIIDPPNYDLQYLLTSQYSPINGAYVGIQHSNPNLLDNWYFADPINQRGQTEYTNGYGIDRWYVGTGGKVEITDGGIVLSHVGGSYGDLIQKFENQDSMMGKQCTFSLIINGELYSKTFVIGDMGSAPISFDNMTLLSVNDRPIILRIYNNNSSDVIQAVKLELGPVQTIANKEGDTWVLNDPPPNKQQELAKCQGYYWKSAPVNASCSTYGLIVWKKNDTTLWLRPSVSQPVTLRARPSIKINGVSPGGEVTLRNNASNATIKGILNVPSDFALTKDKLFYIVITNYVGDVAIEDIFEGTIELNSDL